MHILLPWMSARPTWPFEVGRGAASGGPLHRTGRPRRGRTPPDGAPAEEEADGVTVRRLGGRLARRVPLVARGLATCVDRTPSSESRSGCSR